MTNADKIRAMSSEQLAAWLDAALSSGREWFDARTCNLCKAENAGRCPEPEDGACTRMAGAILDWLEAPADN